MDTHSLKNALSGDGIITDPGRLAGHAVDGVTPQAVVVPDSVEGAARVIKWANDNGASVVPLGGGVLKGVGGKLKSADIVLSTARMNQIIDIDPSNLTVTVQAGVIFGDLQDLVGGVENRCFFPVGGDLKTSADFLCSDRNYKGAYVPLDPPCRDRATMGGILASNLTGPHRLRNRLVRDLVLGVRFISPTGEIIGMGGKTVKNVSGYDMSKLMIGSMGCLGLIAELTIRLLPLPEKKAGIAAGFSSLEAACGFAQKVLDVRLLPTALEILNPAAVDYGAVEGLSLPSGGYAVAMGQAGFTEEVDREGAQLIQMAQDSGALAIVQMDADDAEFFWREVTDDLLENASVRFKANYLFSGFAEMAAAAVRATEGLEAAINVSAGNNVTQVSLVADDPEAAAKVAEVLRTKARELKGGVFMETATPRIKQAVDAWGPERSDAGLMKKIKRKLDPNGVFCPGRFLGGL